MIRGPMRASLDDFDSIIELADECFPRDRDSGGMLARWPHCYIRQPEKVRNCLVMKDGTKVVSNVEYVDQTLLVEGTEMKVAGITGVATLPSHRGRGFMTQLLNYCTTLMREEGYAFSDLGGDRQRYGRFGWERGGREWWFDVTSRSLKAVDAPTGCDVSQYVASSEEIDATLELYEREPLRLRRSRVLHEMLLGRKGKQVWLTRNGGSVVAYVVTDQDEREHEIVEFGGSAEGVHAVLLHLAEALGSEVQHISSSWSHPLNATFFSMSARWGVNSTRMIKIIDLGKTLCGFAHQLGKSYRDLQFQGIHTVGLAVEGTEQQVEIRFSPEGVTVGNVPNHSRALTLSDRQMVRLLFGPGTPRTQFNLPPHARFLEGLLPVDFHLWGNETV